MTASRTVQSSTGGVFSDGPPEGGYALLRLENVGTCSPVPRPRRYIRGWKHAIGARAGERMWGLATKWGPTLPSVSPARRAPMSWRLDLASGSGNWVRCVHGVPAIRWTNGRLDIRSDNKMPGPLRGPGKGNRGRPLAQPREAGVAGGPQWGVKNVDHSPSAACFRDS